jgi:hypothetical protein
MVGWMSRGTAQEANLPRRVFNPIFQEQQSIEVDDLVPRKFGFNHFSMPKECLHDTQ